MLKTKLFFKKPYNSTKFLLEFKERLGTTAFELTQAVVNGEEVDIMIPEDKRILIFNELNTFPIMLKKPLNV